MQTTGTAGGYDSLDCDSSYVLHSLHVLHCYTVDPLISHWSSGTHLRYRLAADGACILKLSIASWDRRKVCKNPTYFERKMFIPAVALKTLYLRAALVRKTEKWDAFLYGISDCYGLSLCDIL